MYVEQWQIDMAKRMPPAIDAFVKGSTPVLAFGDVLTAEVATIGINPSRREFDDGGWLSGPERRLATMESLGAVPGQELTDNQARHVVEDSNRYFDEDRNPYWTWFRPLDTLLKESVGASYTDGSACHLDLVQWATAPVWRGLRSPVERKALLDEGRPQLERLLAQSNVRLVLANGRTVLDQLQKIDIVQWEVVGTLPMGQTTCTLQLGQRDGVRFVGWSTNLQAGHGVSKQFKAGLAAAVASLAVPTAADIPEENPEHSTSKSDVEMDVAGHLPRVLKVASKEQLRALLRRWYEESDAGTVGDVANFGGRPAIAVDLGDHAAVLNVDTKRSAVAAYLAHADANGVDAPWQVVSNTRGRVNKVIFSDDPAAAAGWYVYLREPLVEPTTI